MSYPAVHLFRPHITSVKSKIVSYNPLRPDPDWFWPAQAARRTSGCLWCLCGQRFFRRRGHDERGTECSIDLVSQHLTSHYFMDVFLKLLRKKPVASYATPARRCCMLLLELSDSIVDTSDVTEHSSPNDSTLDTHTSWRPCRSSPCNSLSMVSVQLYSRSASTRCTKT